jgi:putative DNA primase/helicase
MGDFMDFSTCQGTPMSAAFWKDFATTLNGISNSYTEIAIASPGGSEFAQATYYEALTPELLQQMAESRCNISFLNGCKKSHLLANPNTLGRRMAKNSMIFEKNILSFDADCKDFVPEWKTLSRKDREPHIQRVATALLHKLTTHKIPVWFLLYSGNGFHLHFKSKNPLPTQDFKEFYHSVLGYLSCLLEVPFDKNCSNSARLMRLPFSQNWKDAGTPIPTQVLGYQPEANAEAFLRGFQIKALLPAASFTAEKTRLYQQLTLKVVLSFFSYSKWASWKETGDTILCSSPLSEDKTPSFYFNVGKKLYFDFSRSQGGDLFTLIAELAHLDCKKEFKAVLQHARKILGMGEETPSGKVAGDHGRYELRASGVWFVSKTPDDQTNEIWISSHLEVMGYTRDPWGRAWGRLLRIKDPDGLEKTWPMSMEYMAGEGFDLRKQLFHLGVQLNMNKYVRHHLIQYLLTQTPSTRLRCVSRIGWVGESFLLPDCVYSTSTMESVLFQGEAHALPYQQAGSLAQWQLEIGRYCEGNSRLILALCAAFAPPLLHLTGEENFGIHLSGASSIGKTIALMVAGSVWGKASIRGYGSSWRSTLNGLEGLASQHHDALLVLDELAELSPTEAGNAAYMLANGAGKVRGNKEGGIKEADTWRLIFLSAGEIDLATHMQSVGTTPHAGQEIRMLSVEAEAGAGMGILETLHGFPSSGELVRHLRLHSLQQYGTPIRAFLEKLVHDKDIAQKYQESLEGFRAQIQTQSLMGQQLRVLHRFHLLAFAGELSAAYGVVPITGASHAMAKLFETWLAQFGMGRDLESHRILQQVRSFLQRYGLTHFPELTEFHGDVHKCFGFRKKNGDGGYDWLILTEIFREEVCAGYELKKVLEALKREGYLAVGDSKSSRSERLPHMGRARVYQIPSKILEE